MVLSKLKLVEFFDSVISEIDYITEKEILAQIGNERVELHLNERRQVLLSKVNEIQQHCLCQLNQMTTEDEKSNKNKSDDNDDDYPIKKRVFTKWCFAHVYSGLAYLFVVDYYVSDREIGRFKACLKTMFKDCNKDVEEAQSLIQILNPRLRALVPNEGLIRMFVHWPEGDQLFELDSPVIQLKEPYQLESMTIFGPIEVDSSMSSQAIEAKLIRGAKCVSIRDDTLLNTFDRLEWLIKQNVQIENLEISCSVRNRDEFDRLANLLSSTKQLVANIRLVVNNDSFWTMPLKVDLTAMNISITIGPKELLTSPLFEWLDKSPQLQSLDIEWSDDDDEQLSRQHLSCLTSLQELHLESVKLQIDADAFCDLHMLRSLDLEIVGYNEKNDWRFLDSVRDRLEKFSVDAELLSSEALTDMPNLKDLQIYGYDCDCRVVIIDDSDEQNFELFTGLGSLEKLRVLYLDREQEEMIYNPRHFQHLYSLQDLDLVCTQESRLTLFSTQTAHGSSYYQLLFSNLRSLTLELNSPDSLCPQPFSQLTQLTSLDLTFAFNDENINVTRELFDGLDSLTHLKLYSRDEYLTIDSDAFAHLDKLVDARLSNVKQTFEELQASGLFDPCKSIKSITVNMYSNQEPTAVFFDKIDRFVFVTTRGKGKQL